MLVLDWQIWMLLRKQEATFEVSLEFRLQIPHLGSEENKNLRSSALFEHVGFLARKYHLYACLARTVWFGYVLCVDDESLRVLRCQKFYLPRPPRFLESSPQLQLDARPPNALPARFAALPCAASPLADVARAVVGVAPLYA